jgi:hypothetical protein
MIRFLDGREARWKLRVSRLGSGHTPDSWPEVEGKRPFHQAMNEIRTKGASADGAVVVPLLEVLSKSVARFRDWIAELEAEEDKARESMEKERQKGLASAQDELKDLQKSQGQISSRLDRASAQEHGTLQSSWPSLRMQQNTNVAGTERLEGKLRSLSPGAAGRIKAAAAAMQVTLESGNSGKFSDAESGSDLAGRLLRQAESATKESQSRQKSRGRRRRVTGDNYYGQSVVGGDIEIKRDYEVDRRYREDILDEVKGAREEGENREILDSYLRKTVR